MIAVLALTADPLPMPSPAAHGALACGVVSEIRWNDQGVTFDLEALMVTDTTTHKTTWPPAIRRWTIAISAAGLDSKWFDHDGFRTASVAMVRLYLPEKPCAEPCEVRGYQMENMTAPPTETLGSTGTQPPPGEPTAPLPKTHCP